MMRTKFILLFLGVFFTIQLSCQVRKPTRNNKRISFQFKDGVQKLKIPGSKSVLILQIKENTQKIVRVSKTVKDTTYQLNRVKPTKCKMRCKCRIDCWKDPKTNGLIGICGTCTADEDELNGQIEFLSPN